MNYLGESYNESEQRMGSVQQQQDLANRNQSKNFAGPLDAIVEGDSDDLEGGDSEHSYGSLSEVPLDDARSGTTYNKSQRGSVKSKGTSWLGLVGKIAKKRGARKRITVHKESKTQYFDDGSWQEFVLSLSWGHVYDGIK